MRAEMGAKSVLMAVWGGGDAAEALGESAATAIRCGRMTFLARSWSQRLDERNRASSWGEGTCRTCRQGALAKKDSMSLAAWVVPKRTSLVDKQGIAANRSGRSTAGLGTRFELTTLDLSHSRWFCKASALPLSLVMVSAGTNAPTRGGTYYMPSRGIM